jgi:hypothetical protein
MLPLSGDRGGTETCPVTVQPETSPEVSMNSLRIAAVLVFLAAYLAGCSDPNAYTDASTVAAPHFTEYEGLEPGEPVPGGELRLPIGDTLVLDDAGAALMAPNLSGTAEVGGSHAGFVVPIPEGLAEGVVPIPEGLAEGVIPIR